MISCNWDYTWVIWCFDHNHTTGHKCAVFCCRLNSSSFQTCGGILVSLQLRVIYMEKCLLQSFKEIKRSDHFAVSKSEMLVITHVEVKRFERDKVRWNMNRKSWQWQLEKFCLVANISLWLNLCFWWIWGYEREILDLEILFIYLFFRVFLTFKQTSNKGSAAWF